MWHPQETLALPDLQPARRKIHKKSTRNAKDSAEMARIQQYHKMVHTGNTSTAVSSPWSTDRHSSVANIGNDGTLLLRHEVGGPKAGNALSPPTLVARPNAQDIQASPPTPPQTSETHLQPGFYWHDGLHESAAALNRLPSGPSLVDTHDSFDSTDLMPRNPLDGTVEIQRRSRSGSFGSNYLHVPRHRDLNVDTRPRTADIVSAPMLQVPIPHYRIGTPRFSERGTAFLHNSFHTAFSSSTDLRSSEFSNHEFNDLFPPPPGQRHRGITSRRRSPVSWYSPSVSPQPQDLPTPMFRSSSIITPPEDPPDKEDARVIPPSVFNSVAFNPDDSSKVKYQPTNREIAAATPVRLIAEITSVKFLDYDLLSDFFLTYRSFLSPADLARYLVARLRWAVSYNDDAGQVVRVRTFVAMRHWILNYFMDDFEPDLELRILFCELINGLAVDLQRRPGGGGSDLKVVGELKKCWRRTCESVWASPATDPAEQSPPGSRGKENRSVAMKSPIMMAGGGAEKDERAARKAKQQMPAQNYFTYVSPLSARGRIVPSSPFSEQSVHVTSCAMPVRKRSRPILADKDNKTEKAEVTQDPKTSSSKLPQRKPSHRHQRSGSFSDALRDDRAPTSSPNTESVERVESPEPSVPGDLIRGFSLKPNPSNIVFPAPLSPPITDEQDGSQLTPFHADPTNNPAMAKIFGSMRRALSTRQSSKPSLSGGHKATSSGDLRSLRSAERQPRRMLGRDAARRGPEIQCDALAAIVVRAYERNLPGSTELGHNPLALPRDEPVATASDSILVPAPKRPLELSRFNSHVTNSSRSILILDDTGIPEVERTPDLRSVFTGATRSHENLIGKVRPDTAEHNNEAVRDMAMNNTAFLLPDLQSLLAHGHWSPPNLQPMARSTASVATTLTTAPHSPPPAGPLPPLPGMRTVLADRSRVPPNSLNPSIRSGPPASLDFTDAVLDGMGLQARSETEEDSLRSTIYRRSSFVDPSELSLPNHQLRRKPGGNLRDIDTVQNLGLLHRRQSTGSVSTPGASSPTSTILSGEAANPQIASVISGRRLRSRVTDGQLIENARKSSLRLLSTHSSQPNMRPSFEVEVRRLAMIPTREDDGDIEATLLKLEGKFQPNRSSTAGVRSLNNDSESPGSERQSVRGQVRVVGHPDHPETSRLDLEPEIRTPMTETQGASIYHLSQTSHGSVVRVPAVNRNSEVSDRPPAPFESDLATQLRKEGRSSTLPATQERPLSSPRSKALQFRDSPKVVARHFGHKKSRSESAANKKHARDDSGATSSTFLLDENESLYDGASFTSRATHHGRPSTSRSFFIEDEDEENEDSNVAEAEVLNFSSDQHPPTPPATIGAGSEHVPDEELQPGPAPSAELRNSFQFPERQSSERDQSTPTPIDKPVLRNPPSSPVLRISPVRPLPTHHTPFILAFRSAALAAQMTLIEKDALDCIDWKDLVNLQWSQNTTSIRDWASFLHTSSSDKVSSIDLIITRFNLVIKWCISSILLCGTAVERMQCIVKFIHIAVHARKRLHNFATAAQLTIALCSSDLARLTSTWALVPTVEKDALKSLEGLVSPVRNFAALRVEMETAAAGVEDVVQPTTLTVEGRGVIPFLGVYTRDLALNAQNPAFVTPETAPTDEALPQKEKLVNFERYRTAASIVKNVLRLLDASAKYTIRPDPEVLSRCLWLAALGDGEITSLSKGLE